MNLQQEQYHITSHLKERPTSSKDHSYSGYELSNALSVPRDAKNYSEIEAMPKHRGYIIPLNLKKAQGRNQSS